MSSTPVHTGTMARPARGRELLRDGLVFVVLCCVTVVLFAVTLLLFHSFEDHRVSLARQYGDRGRAALRSGHAEDAVSDFRVALGYEPNERDTQFALAQALAAAGHIEEARNYFLNLWEQRPGEGITNLQLARLERAHGTSTAAVNYYRAAIFGSWEGDGVLRRRETRLEMADYFRQIGNEAAAKQELLIAAGNAPPEEYLEIALGDRLQSIGDPGDALQLYTKALQQDPHRRSALIKAGRAAFQLGDYANAERLLSTALHEAPTKLAPASADNELQDMIASARRIPELNISRELPAAERASHLLVAAGIAHRRLQACMAQHVVGSATPLDLTASSPLQALQAQWKGAAPVLVRSRLEHDSSAADGVARLITETESQSAMVAGCGSPSGDDALLLKQAGEAQGDGFQPESAKLEPLTTLLIINVV